MYSTVPQNENALLSSNIDSLLRPKSVSLMWPSVSKRMLQRRQCNVMYLIHVLILHSRILSVGPSPPEDIFSPQIFLWSSLQWFKQYPTEARVYSCISFLQIRHSPIRDIFLLHFLLPKISTIIIILNLELRCTDVHRRRYLLMVSQTEAITGSIHSSLRVIHLWRPQENQAFDSLPCPHPSSGRRHEIRL